MQAMLASLLGVAVAVGSGSGQAGAAVTAAGQTLGVRGFLRHSRAQESAADQAGVRFLTEAGLPVAGLTTFMEKLANQELLPDSQQSEYVRTHPLSQDRVEFLRHAQNENPGTQEPAAWKEPHARVKAKLLGYLFPDRALATEKGDSVSARYARAIAHYRKAKIQKALEETDALIALEQDNPYFYELKGQILFEQGRVKEAVGPLSRAIALLPKAGLIRAAYAHALLESGDPKGAIPHFLQSLQTEPRNSTAHHLLAIAYGKTGQEGLSRLHLAEEALVRGKADMARTEANLALVKLAKGATGTQRARDILALLDEQDRKNKGKKKK